MSWFKKEEKIHFERDEEGKVISTIRSGDVDRTPVTKALLAQQKRGPSRWESYKERRGREKEAYRESFKIARLRHAREAGSRAGKTTWIDRLDSFRRSPSRQTYSPRNNYNPFGTMFDKGLKFAPSKKPKKTSSKKYTVIGGKAYPIAGLGKKKKRKSKRKQDMFSDPFSSSSFGKFGKWKF